MKKSKQKVISLKNLITEKIECAYVGLIFLIKIKKNYPFMSFSNFVILALKTTRTKKTGILFKFLYFLNCIGYFTNLIQEQLKK